MKIFQHEYIILNLFQNLKNLFQNLTRVKEIGIGILFIIFIACSSQKNINEPRFIDIFIAGKEKAPGQNNQPYAQFREQNVTVTASGKIVVVVQGRNASDWSDRSGQDLWCKISSDNGLTWSEPILMDSQGEKSICPNASVYDEEKGRILSLYTVFEWPYTDPESRKTWEGLKNREYIIYSDDEGITWSEPREITYMVKTDTVIQVFGSGEGIQLKTGEKKGRLIVPGGDFYPPNKRVFAWISDDHGETWKSSDVVPNPHNRLTPCENAIVELADGTLLMNERNHGLGQRWQAYSKDASETWSPFEPVMDLPSVSCNASIIRVNYDGKDILLYAGPVGPNPDIQNGKDYEEYKFQPGERRSNGVVFASYDNGKTWPFRKLVVPGQFAYSSLRELPDGTIGLFYETNFHKDVKLVKFSLDWLFKDLNNRLQYIDISTQKERQVTVEKIPGQYLGQPNAVLLADGKTIIVGYPEGHGHPNTILKRSADGGLTWSDRLKTPDNFIDDHYAPTLHRLTDPNGKERIIIFVVTPYVMTSISEDNGQTWTPFEPVYPGENHKGHAPPMSIIQIRNSGGNPVPGNYFALYHDHISKNPGIISIIKIITYDGGLTWSLPQSIGSHPDCPGAQPCEPCVVRSPNGKQLLCLMRENSRQYNSLFMTSDDEGETWSDMKALSLGLTGDRHNARYAPDGRLVVTIRDLKGKWSFDNADEEKAFFMTRRMEYDGRFHRDFVAWIGTYDDIINQRPGQYIVRLIDHQLPNADCGYSGLECLPDGTFISTTYAVIEEGEVQSIVCIRFKLKELDELANYGPPTGISYIRFRLLVGQGEIDKNRLYIDRIHVTLENNYILKTYE